jgi:hypothetical protein
MHHQDRRELRKPKLNAWNAIKENARDWPLNMMTEARAGFRAFTKARARAGGSRFRGAAPSARRE